MKELGKIISYMFRGALSGLGAAIMFFGVIILPIFLIAQFNNLWFVFLYPITIGAILGVCNYIDDRYKGES